MLNAIIVTDGGKDPVPQKDDTETLWIGRQERTVWSLSAVPGHSSEVAAGVLLYVCSRVRGLVRAPWICTSV